MKFARLAWLFGTFAVFAGCSGEYQVGIDAPKIGAPNVGAPNAGAPNAGAPNEGAPNEGLSTGGGSPLAGNGNSVAGASSGGAGSGTLDGQGFCYSPSSTAEPVQFAPPSVVYQRLLKFLFAVDDQPAPDSLPAVTTRQWAGGLAASALASLSTPSAKGMDRFVSGWWTGTPTPEYWAAEFSSKRGTLADLLSTNSLLPHGSGVLTDPAVLSHTGISTRGDFVARKLLCLEVPPEPAGVSLPPPPQPGLTRRAQHEQLVANAACSSCHILFDPIGYALGNFETDGSYHTVENDLPIVTVATLKLARSGNLAFDAQSLGQSLATTCEVALCLTGSMLQDATTSAHLPKPASEAEVALVASQFAAARLSLPELVRLVVESDVFLRAD